MGRVGEHARRLRKERGLTLAVVAAAIPCDKGHLSRVENGQRRPTAHLVRRMDQVLGARGELIAHAALSVSSGMDDEPGETAELLSRVRGDDTTPATIEALQATVHGLCCQYSWRNAYDLRREAQKWVAEVARLLDRPTGLRAHRELLTAAGWLALLIGCLEYDTGMVVGAEATRAEARRYRRLVVGDGRLVRPDTGPVDGGDGCGVRRPARRRRLGGRRTAVGSGGKGAGPAR
jgi:transcriptional regulator with XRE-family HTH domain